VEHAVIKKPHTHTHIHTYTQTHTHIHTHTHKHTHTHTQHYTTRALFFPPHTQLKLNTVCTEGGIRKGQLVYGWNEIG